MHRANGIVTKGEQQPTALGAAGNGQVRKMKEHLFNAFDAVYCVNLDRRPDRWKRFCSDLPGDWPFREVQRVSAIDGRIAPPPAWWNQGRGAWGCYRTHLRLIEDALNSGLQSILLLEDDAKFCRDFTEKVGAFFQALPEDWGMVYLGGQHLLVNYHPPKKINDLVFQPFNVNRTHAFALRGPMMAKVYKHLFRIDWDQGHHIDHHLGRLLQRREDPIYCPQDWLVGQEQGRSNISGRSTEQRFWVDADEIDKVQPEHEPFVVVLGLHSSGSSCLAGVLHHLGLHLGNKLTGYYGHDPQSGQCGFEAVGLRNICEKAIPFPCLEHKLPREAIWRNLRAWINEKRREAVTRGTMAAGKYPQLCQMGRQLKNICGDTLKIVVSDRPIQESIKSLQRRYPEKDPAELQRHQHWLEEGKQWLLKHIDGSQQRIVSFADLLRSPREEAERIAEFLGIDPDESQLQAAMKWVDPEKRHISGSTV